MSPDKNASAAKQEADVFSSACSSRTALQHLTGRWGVLIIAALKLDGEPMRFGEIRRRVEGVSERMLSQTLAQLERDGVVSRTVHSSIPPHVDYQLTSMGAKIARPLIELVTVLEAEITSVLKAQDAYDAGKTAASA